ncbi:MAG: DoxX family protein [Candidatus Paceibacterota bacterium]|jgi:putative oxidoreductase
MMEGKCEGMCGKGHCFCKVAIRVFIAALFIYAGYGKLTGIEGTAGYIASAGLPYPLFLAWAAGLLEVIAGVLLVIGSWGKRCAAWALIGFTVVATYFFHLKGWFAGDAGQMVSVLKNLAIVGGLLMLSGCPRCESSRCEACAGGKCDVHN